MDIKKRYEKRIRKYKLLEKKIEKVIRMYSNMRIFIAILTVVLCTIFFKMDKNNLFMAALFFMIALFIFIARKHGNIIKLKTETDAIISINEDALKRLRGDFTEVQDDGSEFCDSSHSYSGDLDIFGRASLFQWMNCAFTFTGRQRLASILKGKIKFSKQDIIKRQEAVKELSCMEGFRQRLQGKAMMNKKSLMDPENLEKWGNDIGRDISSFFIGVLYIDTIITVLIFLMASLGKISFGFFILMLALNIVILQSNKKYTGAILESIGNYSKTILCYMDMVKMIGRRNYKSSLLNELKYKIENEGFHGYEELKELSKISGKISDRRNAVYLVLNVIFFMDFHYYRKLNSWKRKNGMHIKDIAETAGEFEELCSFANIAYSYDDFTFPSIDENGFIIKGKDIKHPLLGAKAVGNDIGLNGRGEAWLITGSNMAGKSTYLRTIGINLVLAYCGSPVRAESFACSIMDICTCMRIGDNLEKSISSFYAEILRVKAIIERCDEGRRVFYLLDEIFKGTNSRDRHKGAEILINELSKENTLGLVSTHDLELADIENEKIRNYHFEEHYEENKIKFDYKLKSGVSTTQNALYLMRMAGIKC